MDHSLSLHPVSLAHAHTHTPRCAHCSNPRRQRPPTPPRLTPYRDHNRHSANSNNSGDSNFMGCEFCSPLLRTGPRKFLRRILGFIDCRKSIPGSKRSRFPQELRGYYLTIITDYFPRRLFPSSPCPAHEAGCSFLSFFFFFKISFIYMRRREREHEQKEGQREREKQTPCSAGSPLWDLIPGP